MASLKKGSSQALGLASLMSRLEQLDRISVRIL
jgi:hypothetical protein